MQGIRKTFFLLLTAACLAGQLPRLWADVPLTGGVFSAALLATFSGGGTAASGTLLLSSVNLGGPVYSAAALTGGNFSLQAGGAPAVTVYAPARPDLATAHCYPVPFRPSAGHTRITFTGLTDSARVLVYTLSGQLVRTLDKSGFGETLDWDVKNSRGQDLSSGVYLFVVKSARQTATGKLMVLR